MVSGCVMDGLGKKGISIILLVFFGWLFVAAIGVWAFWSYYLRPWHPATTELLRIEVPSRAILTIQRFREDEFVAFVLEKSLPANGVGLFPVKDGAASYLTDTILEVRYSQNENAVWIVERTKRGVVTLACINLTSGKFVHREYGERMPALSYSDINWGKRIRDGQTYMPYERLLPDYAKPENGVLLGRCHTRISR